VKNNFDTNESESTDQSGKYELVDVDFSLRRLGGDSRLLNEIVQIFFEDSPEMMRELAVAVKAFDARGARQSAHALRGLVSNFGESEAVELVRKIELAAKEDDMVSARRYYDDFRDKYETLHRELTDLVS